MLIHLTPRRIARIAELTQNNDHGAALVSAAQALRLKDLEQIAARIDSQTQLLGYLSTELQHRRRSAYEDLLFQARRCLTTATYQALYMAL